MSKNTYERAKADGFTGDKLISARLWLGEYSEWYSQQKRIENELKTGTNTASNAFGAVVDAASTAANTVIDSAKIFTWIYQNWQISIVGGIALIILVKRL